MIDSEMVPRNELQLLQPIGGVFAMVTGRGQSGSAMAWPLVASRAAAAVSSAAPIRHLVMRAPSLEGVPGGDGTSDESSPPLLVSARCTRLHPMYPVLFARKGPILAFSAVKGPFLALNARNRALILGAGRVRAGVYSALPVDRIPTPDQRPALRRAARRRAPAAWAVRQAGAGDDPDRSDRVRPLARS